MSLLSVPAQCPCLVSLDIPIKLCLERDFVQTYIFVHLLQFLPVLVVVLQGLLAPVERLEPAGLPELVVAGNAVVAASLEVQRQEILAEVFAFAEKNCCSLL